MKTLGGSFSLGKLKNKFEKKFVIKVSNNCIFEINQVNMVFKPIYSLEVGYIIMIIMCKS
jgi:hypothetical protein